MTINLTFTENADRYAVRTSDDYVLDFLGGDDTLVVQAGSTTARMGAGNDFVRVDAGYALLAGQGGSDRFDIAGTATHINGGADDDLFNIRGGGSHFFVGGTGGDRFNFLVDASRERLYGGDGNDLFVGYSHTVSGSLYGDAGNDRFVGFGNFGGAVVKLYGGTGNDTYRADPTSPATFVELAGEGIDTVQVAPGHDYTLSANFENLVVRPFAASSDAASLIGNAAGNLIVGGGNAETIQGLAGSDTLYGKGGDDVIDGGDGADRIHGGSGIDTLTGGAGADVFVYAALSDAPYDPTYSAIDWIAGYQSADRIDLSAIDANAAMPGNQAFQFVEGASSAAGTLHLEYDPAGWGWGFLIGHVDGDGVPDLLICLTAAEQDSWPVVTLDNLVL